jgi:hypothetical protein
MNKEKLMNQSFNTTAMSVIIESRTYSDSAFGANDEGEAVFFNKRIVDRMDLQEGQMVFAHCIPNYEDKREHIPWRCIRIEEAMDSDAVEGYIHAVEREDRKDARDKRIADAIRQLIAEHGGSYTLEELSYETGLSVHELEPVVTTASNGFKEVTAYTLVEK